jgi:Leucine-rich repeat (LRR) protein
MLTYADLTGLTALSISNNHMTFLPPELSGLSHLKDLHVESPYLKSPSPQIAGKA